MIANHETSKDLKTNSCPAMPVYWVDASPASTGFKRALEQLDTPIMQHVATMRPEAANTQLEAVKEFLRDDMSTTLSEYQRLDNLTPWQLFCKLLDLRP